MTAPSNIAHKFGTLIADQLRRDPHFYFFSPDETTSNKLDAVYKSATRAWNLPTKEWDLPEAPAGHIIELLSENTLFALLSGHIKNGEQGILTSYEAFLSIIISQIVQEVKFIQQSTGVDWRPDYPALNLLSTSTCWRQDHNGFSHQSPLVISTLLDLPGRHANCFFPVDDVSAEAIMQKLLATKNVVNLTTFNKTDEPRWIDSSHARFQLDNGGASVFRFVGDDPKDINRPLLKRPDFIFTAAGDIATREALYAIKILRHDLPCLKFRFVGIATLSHRAIGTTDRPLPQSTFDEYFASAPHSTTSTPSDATSDASLDASSADQCHTSVSRSIATSNSAPPIIANFHGYPHTLESLLTEYTDRSRLHVHGFSDRGSTTTPFEMLSMNHASRYHLALDVAEHLNRSDLIEKYTRILRVNTAYAREHGHDLPPITNFVL